VEYIALAGHLIVAAISLIHLEEIKLVWKVNNSARAVLIVTLPTIPTLALRKARIVPPYNSSLIQKNQNKLRLRVGTVNNG
jgi:hypothetical protein